jgi:hypothetical protein
VAAGTNCLREPDAGGSAGPRGLAKISDEDELPDPPFDTALLENWFVRSPTGEVNEVSPPLVDFDAETAEWR